MLKYWRVWLLVVMIIGSVLAIGFKVYPYGRNGVEIVYVDQESPAKSFLEQGMLITEINGNTIKTLEDWQEATKELKGAVKLTANAKTYDFFVNESLGIEATDIDRTNLDFGLDLKGGTRIILRPKGNITEETIDQIISTLQTRANIYGLKEMKFYPVRGIDTYYVQIEAAGIGSDIVNNLLSTQGKFEAKILKTVAISDTTTLQLGTENYPLIFLDNKTIKINDNTISPGDNFTLNDIKFQYINKTQSRLTFLADVFTGSDIELVYTDPQRSGVVPRGDVYSFYFAVLVSEQGAKRFADVTTGIPKYFDIQVGEEYLESQLFLYLDDQLVTQLNIAASLGGQIVQSPQIQGTRATHEEATAERLRLQTILRSGALPVTLETASIDVISPTFGSGFFISGMYAAFLAGVVVVTIIIIRYRSIRIGFPLVLIGLSEVIIILGIASTNDVGIWGSVLVINFLLISLAWWKKHEIDVYAWVGAILIPLLGMMSWTIDLPAIGGIIAAIGTGVDHQIIIADEAKKKEKKIYTLKEKIRRAFFIIFGAAATTIAAMLPLMFLGIGLVRGFAITTIVGVLVGILITRPAYAKIIESVIK
jgi:preprotein translocase subunit SecD